MRNSRRRLAAFLPLLVVAGGLAVGGSSPVALAAAPTVVTIQFDDGNADQFAALPILQAHGVGATFYVNSRPVRGPNHMTWTQLADLAAAGNEIAGHTITHANLKHLKT